MGLDHFEGKEAIDHVAEAQVKGILAASEIHGTEIPGHLSAAMDAARETSILLPMGWILIASNSPLYIQNLAILALGWLFWKTGRSAWLGWSRLERLHRIVAQEKWEVEHNRSQEREELKAMYAAKGFEGKLLEDVIDVLTADEDRLLRVMVEEELGLSLESHEHPLKQAIGAFLGVFITAVIILILVTSFGFLGAVIGSLITLVSAATLSAYYEGNRLIPAVVWNLGIWAIAFSAVYFLSQIIFPERL